MISLRYTFIYIVIFHILKCCYFCNSPFILHARGPPESPLQASLMPWRCPAQIMPGPYPRVPCSCWHILSAMRRTSVLCRTSGLEWVSSSGKWKIVVRMSIMAAIDSTMHFSLSLTLSLGILMLLFNHTIYNLVWKILLWFHTILSLIFLKYWKCMDCFNQFYKA